MMAEPKLRDAWDRSLLLLPIINTWCLGEDQEPVGFYEVHPYRDSPQKKEETQEEFDERFFWSRIQLLPEEIREKVIKKRLQDDSATS